MTIRSESHAQIIRPTRFYQIIKSIEAIPPEVFGAIDLERQKMEKLCDGLNAQYEALRRTGSDYEAQAEAAMRRRNPLRPLEADDDVEGLQHTLSGASFISVIFQVVRQIQATSSAMLGVLNGLEKPDLLWSGKVPVTSGVYDRSAVEQTAYEMDINREAIEKFTSSLIVADSLGGHIVTAGSKVDSVLDRYYRALLNRHQTQGLKIHEDPITTDVAMSIFENVDAHGEVESGTDPDKISAYAMNKAVVLLGAVRSGLVGDFMADPTLLMTFIEDSLLAMWEIAGSLQGRLRPTLDTLLPLLGGRRNVAAATTADFKHGLRQLRSLDPLMISYREKHQLLTPEERHELDFRNETLADIVVRLRDEQINAEAIVQYILSRKAELRRYYQEENSFYTCKVGSGNPFLGEAPGALQVVPGTRPTVALDEIVGSGFAEVKEFIGAVEQSSRWHDLFVATSPSRTGDKSNVLLIGPQGSGKTEVLRAMGADRKSIGVFAQGSDFLTCWKGEAEKNPKRLFEACLKLQKESGRHVHILIDEVDTILNSDMGRESFGATNLSTEFQVLMDGIVHYPQISMWGATNNPERIPMPLIRRFSKVVIVGELSEADRVRLLKHFSSFLPLDGFDDAKWRELAARLDGAVGDTLRKIVDHVWRHKMSDFVRVHNEVAESASRWLSRRGTTFQISSFSSGEREELHRRLRPFVRITPQDLDQSITEHLQNVAIHSEIETAKATYARARAFLSKLRKADVAQPPAPPPS